MLSLFATPTLHVTIEQDMIFVNPTTDTSFPSEDAELRGSVLLTLPSRRSVKRIEVVLEGICDACGTSLDSKCLVILTYP